MGGQSGRYLTRAMENFVMQAAKAMVHESCDAARAFAKTPFVIPPQPPGSNPSPYQLLSKLNLLQIKDEYEDLCEKIGELKRKNKTDMTSFKRDLKKILKDCKQNWIDDIDLTNEPSDIATLYLTKKHRRLGTKPEMLKKRLAEARDYVGSPNMKDRARLLKKINKTIEALKTLNLISPDGSVSV